MYDEEGRKINLGQQVGMNLSGMSVTELENYIENLKAEIARADNEIRQKQASAETANAFFK